MEKNNNIFDIRGKVIIITGGAGNLGSGYAQFLKEQGGYVVVWDNCKLDLLKSMVTKGLCNVAERVDIVSEEEVKKAVGRVMKVKKRIDVLINNAAVNPAVDGVKLSQLFAPYEDYPMDIWEKELKVNLTGMMMCTKYVARAMIKQGQGSIINVSSDVSSIAHDHRVYDQVNKFKSIAYTTTKTAVLGFTRQWAARMGMHNVRVNSFSLGGVKTANVPDDFAKRFGDMNMLARMARPNEYNGAIQFLCSDASSFMTGANLIVDGGKSSW